jgi:NADH-quinone oxidoreductase subunit G
MPKITINGRELDVPEGTNVVQAATMADQEIPHYCYHPGLSVAGNCRMCLVEIKALSTKQANPLPKLQIGCNTIVQDGMVVESDNERVREARSSVLEFLLINHPIDCPICDQAGECKLQEYYMDYGGYHSRFALEQKVDKDKAIAIGPDVMLDQERCILCTRCIRFVEEFTETHELTLTERGDHTELTLAEGATLDNDYATNVVDICPVGALTSREFRFQARVWYLDSAPSICTGCSTGCNVEVHSRGDSIYRLKPRANAEVNGYWMCDAGRRTFESNAVDSRLPSSFTREGGRFLDLDATAVAKRVARSLQACKRVGVVVSASATLEEGFLLGEIVDLVGGGPKIVTSSATSEIPDDGKLISTDRYPNRKGLVSLGYVESSGFDADCDGVLVGRCDPAAEDEARWAPVLEKAMATVVFDDRLRETVAFADHVLAVASHFEAPGAYMNRQGRIQRCSAAVAAPGSAVPGWEALGEVLAVLGGPRFESHEQLLRVIVGKLGGDAAANTQVGQEGVVVGA